MGRKDRLRIRRSSRSEVSVWIVNLTRPKYLFPFELKPTNSVEPDSYVTSASFFGQNNVAVKKNTLGGRSRSSIRFSMITEPRF
nr:unnamed protein product [Callosobruchus analis]